VEVLNNAALLGIRDILILPAFELMAPLKFGEYASNALMTTKSVVVWHAYRTIAAMQIVSKSSTLRPMRALFE
jgi:hypothetical protein